MLRKLMKYELKATGRTLVPLYCALISFAIISKLFFVNDSRINIDDSTMKGIFAFITTLGYAFTMASIFITTLFIIIQRFYKNLLGDQGYLMHTLPIASWKNILNKLLVGCIWIIVSGFVAILSVIILAFNSNGFKFNFNELFVFSSQLNAEFGVNGWMLLLKFIFMGFLSLASSIIMIYACISIGQLFNKRKILASFGAFIGLNLLMDSVVGFLSFNISTKLESYFQSLNKLQAVNTFLTLAIIINLVFFIIYFFITNYIIKNKLNLE